MQTIQNQYALNKIKRLDRRNDFWSFYLFRFSDYITKHLTFGKKHLPEYSYIAKKYEKKRTFF